MSGGERPQGNDTTRLREVYVVELREHALALVWMGYQRMAPAAFAESEEDDITGELVRQIKSAIEDSEAPVWVEHYSVSEQVRSAAPGKLSKRRPIVDVEFERHRRGIRPRLRFEAKRLGRGAGVSGYLGEEGLGAFLVGHYSRTHGEAGMLGYVQTDTEAIWAYKIAAKLAANPGYCRLAADGAWRRLDLTSAPQHSYQTAHLDTHDIPLLVVHVLLRFCPLTAGRD